MESLWYVAAQNYCCHSASLHYKMESADLPTMRPALPIVTGRLILAFLPYRKFQACEYSEKYEVESMLLVRYSSINGLFRLNTNKRTFEVSKLLFTDGADREYLLFNMKNQNMSPYYDVELKYEQPQSSCGICWLCRVVIR
jgi:hypothetical protein